MKKLSALYVVLLIFVACNNTVSESETTNEDQIKFENNWKAFEKHHVRGIENKDLDLFLELYADSVKWSPPNWNNNGQLQLCIDLV